MKLQLINQSGVELKYATDRSSGMDLVANIEASLYMDPMDRILIPTGVFVKMEPGEFEAQVRPKSGLALKQGLTVLNTPGTIDNDYFEEIGVIVINLSMEVQEIKPKQKIAQLVFAKYLQVDSNDIQIVDEFNKDFATNRNGGFGSTGEFVDGKLKMESGRHINLTEGNSTDSTKMVQSVEAINVTSSTVHSAEAIKNWENGHQWSNHPKGNTGE